MTNCTEENNMSASSSTAPTEVPQSSVFDNLASMKHELSDIDEHMRSLRRIQIRSPRKYVIGNKFDADSSSSGDEKGCFLFNLILISLCV